MESKATLRDEVQVELGTSVSREDLAEIRDFLTDLTIRDQEFELPNDLYEEAQKLLKTLHNKYNVPN